MNEPKDPEQERRAELWRREALRLEAEQRSRTPVQLDLSGVRRGAGASFGVGKLLLLLLAILGGLYVLKLASRSLGLG
jgi:hypothetical protein